MLSFSSFQSQSFQLTLLMPDSVDLKFCFGCCCNSRLEDLAELWCWALCFPFVFSLLLCQVFCWAAAVNVYEEPTLLQKWFGRAGEAAKFGILLGDTCDIWQDELCFVLDSGLCTFGMYPMSAISTGNVLTSSNWGTESCLFVCFFIPSLDISSLPFTSFLNSGFWKATCPPSCTSPLLVFVNSKSGDNQGVKFLRRFKQLLNPAQVFDLMNGGPHLG